jgi:hypothetical protein
MTRRDIANAASALMALAVMGLVLMWSPSRAQVTNAMPLAAGCGGQTWPTSGTPFPLTQDANTGRLCENSTTTIVGPVTVAGTVTAVLNGPFGTQTIPNSLAVTDLSLQAGGAALAAINAGVGTFGASGFPTQGIALCLSDSGTATTCDKGIAHTGDGGLEVWINGGSISNTGFNVTGTLPAFTATPTFKIDQTTPGTTNGVQTLAGSVTSISAQTTGGANVKRIQVANNTTSIAICAAACTYYGERATNNSATIAYIKYYNVAQGSVTCGAGTIADEVMIPANASGAGIVTPVAGAIGVAYSTALTACITTGYADADATAPAASTYLISVFTK